MKVDDIAILTHHVKSQVAGTVRKIENDTLDYMNSRGIYFETMEDRQKFRQGLAEAMEVLVLEIVKIIAKKTKRKKGGIVNG